MGKEFFAIPEITTIKFQQFDSNLSAYTMFCIDFMDNALRIKPWVAKIARGSGKWRWDLSFCKSYYEQSKTEKDKACVVVELYGPAMYRYGKVIDFKTGELQEGFLYVSENGIRSVEEDQILWSSDKGLFINDGPVKDLSFQGHFISDDVPF